MSTLQDKINEDLRQQIDMKAFVHEKVQTKFKNTSDRKCSKCGSDEIHVESRQTRSADETTTKIYECLKCGNKWREY